MIGSKKCSELLLERYDLLYRSRKLLLDSGEGALEPGSASLLDSGAMFELEDSFSLFEDTGTELELDSGGRALEPGSAALLDSGTMFEQEDSFPLFEDAGTKLDSGTTLELDSSALAELEDFSPSDEEDTESFTSKESSANSHNNEESAIQIPELTSQKTPTLRSFTQYSSPETDFSHFGKSFSESTPFNSFFAELEESSEQASASNTHTAPRRCFFIQSPLFYESILNIIFYVIHKERFCSSTKKVHFRGL